MKRNSPDIFVLPWSFYAMLGWWKIWTLAQFHQWFPEWDENFYKRPTGKKKDFLQSFPLSQSKVRCAGWIPLYIHIYIYHIVSPRNPHTPIFSSLNPHGAFLPSHDEADAYPAGPQPQPVGRGAAAAGVEAPGAAVGACPLWCRLGAAVGWGRVKDRKNGGF